MSRNAGKRVLVTGAGRNIGLAIVRRYAQEGARVLLSDVTPALVQEGLASLGPLADRVCGFVVDVRSAGMVQGMVAEMVSVFGGMDICINNAGIFPNHLVLDMDEADWDRVMDTNAKGTFLVSKAAARQMVRQQIGGHIVNISSGSYKVGRVGSAHYCASKAAVVMLTQVLAMELASYRIQVNSIAPGLVDSDNLTPEYTEAFVRQVPWGRIGSPDDIAAACVMLTGSDCEYITGQTISVDGGATAGRFGLPFSDGRR